MKILLLGAEGGLGQAFRALFSADPSQFEMITLGRNEVDLTAPEQEIIGSIWAHKPQLIINCAAYNNVDKAEEEPELACRVNGTAVGYIAKAAEKCGARLVHYSTNYVFCGTHEEGYAEYDSPTPASTYGASKLLGEQELQRVMSNFYIIRTGWLYGRKGKNGKKSFVDIILQKASNKEAAPCADDEFGSPTYYRDLAVSTMNLVATSTCPPGIYHLCNEGRASRYEWAKEIALIKNLDIEINPCSRKQFQGVATRPQYGILTNRNFYPLPPWQDSLREFLKDYELT